LNSKVEVLACIKRDEKTAELFNAVNDLTYFENKDELIESLNRNECIFPRIVVFCIDFLLEKDHISYLSIKDDLMYKNASLVIYGKDIDLEVRQKLYTLDIKGIIDENDINKGEILSHIMRRSNLYSSTFKNNLVRGLIDYNNLGDESKKLTYLLDFLIYRYEISYRDSADIRLALIFLLIAFKQNKIVETSKLINTIFKSQSVNTLYKRYNKPKSFNEKILSILLQFNKDPEIANYIHNINSSSVELELIEEIQKIYDAKNIAIASYQDINFFWEQLNLEISNKYTNLVLDIFLSTTYNALVNFLVRANYLLASIKLFDLKKIILEFKFIGTKNIELKEYAENISATIANINILIDEDDETKISIIYDISSYELEMNDETPEEIKSDLIIDTSTINSMHYKDNKKISATQFLEDFEIDNEILDDLNDNAAEVRDLLYKEELLNQNTLIKIASVLGKYAIILRETIEFEDLAFSLEGLSTLFANLSIDTVDESKKEMLGFYIQGLIDDLSSWKHHIFLEPNTPDIHYLDASLLENASEIESFISSTPEDDKNRKEENDDDLEFF